MNENENNTVDVSVLLDVTRQKLMAAMLANTELEALVVELKNKINELQTPTKE